MTENVSNDVFLYLGGINNTFISQSILAPQNIQQTNLDKSKAYYDVNIMYVGNRYTFKYKRRIKIALNDNKLLVTLPMCFMLLYMFNT